LNWLIIRTEHSKEQYVERQIANMEGCLAWWPAELRAIRIHRRSKTRKTEPHSILPHRVFAAFPAALYSRIVNSRYVDAIVCDAASMPLQIPHSQIVTFRQTIDQLNRETLALVEMGTPKQRKAQWKDMKEALEDMIRRASEQLQEVA